MIVLPLEIFFLTANWAGLAHYDWPFIRVQA